MLASILPGLREIRTPLAVGYAWILVLYLAVGYRLPPPDQASGVLADIYRVGQIATPAGLAVVASVVAYLLGIVILPVTGALTNWILRWRETLPYWLTSRIPGGAPESKVEEAFEELIVARLAERIRNDGQFRDDLVRHGADLAEFLGADFDPDRLDEVLRTDASAREQAVEEILALRRVLNLDKELPLVVERMRREDDTAGAEYDRLMGEFEFRSGMAWPLLGLIVTLAVRVTPWSLLAVPAVLLLLKAASMARLEARLHVARTVGSRRYDDRALQMLEAVPAKHLLSEGNLSLSWARGAARVVRTLAVSADGLHAAGGTADGHVIVWDLETGQQRLALHLHRDEINEVAFSPDGQLLASASNDQTVQLLNVATGAVFGRLDHPSAVYQLTFSPDSQRLATVIAVGVLMWQVEDKEQMWRQGLDHFVSWIKMTPDAELLAGLGNNDVVRLEGISRQTVATIPRMDWGEVLDDGRLMIGASVSRGPDDELSVWRVLPNGGARRQSVMRVVDARYPFAVQRRTGQVAVGTGLEELLLLNPESGGGKTDGRRTGVNVYDISAMVWTPDAATILIATNTGAVYCWDVASGRTQRRLAVRRSGADERLTGQATSTS